MEMMNRAIEAAADFRGFMEKVQRGPDVEWPPDAELMAVIGVCLPTSA